MNAATGADAADEEGADEPDGASEVSAVDEDVEFKFAPGPTQLVPVNPAGVIGFVLA